MQRLAKYFEMTVSELLREYVDAVAAGRRWQLVDDDDALVGYAFLVER